jgi:hypothetical protein
MRSSCRNRSTRDQRVLCAVVLIPAQQLATHDSNGEKCPNNGESPSAQWNADDRYRHPPFSAPPVVMSVRSASSLEQAGLRILAGWPSSSYWAIGTLVGVSVLMTGISRVIIASKIKSGVGAVQDFARGTA